MEDRELVKNLSFTGKLRTTLYISPPKIESVYVQRVSQVTELSQNQNFKGGLKGDILGFLGADLSGEKGLGSKVAINPMLQAIIAENAAQKLKRIIDISSSVSEAGELLRYIGPAQFTLMDHELEAADSELPAEICQTIETKRKIQEKIWRFKDDTVRSVLLTFVVNDQIFASIASTDFIDINTFSSYFGEPDFGVLCMIEDIHPQVTFLNPLWVWNEAS